jgi:hypothetical protein
MDGAGNRSIASRRIPIHGIVQGDEFILALNLGAFA